MTSAKSVSVQATVAFAPRPCEWSRKPWRNAVSETVGPAELVGFGDWFGWGGLFGSGDWAEDGGFGEFIFLVWLAREPQGGITPASCRICCSTTRSPYLSNVCQRLADRWGFLGTLPRAYPWADRRNLSISVRGKILLRSPGTQRMRPVFCILHSDVGLMANAAQASARVNANFSGGVLVVSGRFGEFTRTGYSNQSAKNALTGKQISPY